MPPEERMAILSAFSFLILGIVLLLFHWKNELTSDIAHVLIIPIFLICFFTIISYILGVNDATVLSKDSVSINSGIAFFVICFAILMLRPDSWFMKLYTAPDTGGMISRILLLPVILLPVITGILRVFGERRGMFTSGTGTVLETVLYTFSLIILISLTAVFIGKIEREKNASEEALKLSEKRYRNLAENIPDMIVRFDRNLRFIYGNQAVLDRTGLPYDAHLGKKAGEYGTSTTTAPGWEKAAKEVLLTGKSKRVVHTSNWQGDERIYDIIIIPEKDKNENVCSVISIARDITRMKEAERDLQQQAASLEESEKRFRELVKHAPTAIYEVDFLKNKITTVNDAMCSLSGYSREELLTMNISDLLDDEGKSRFNARIKECIEGKLPKAHVEYRVNRKDGNIINAVLDMKFKFDQNGKPYGAIVVGHDITERRKILEALAQNEQRLKYHLENSPLAVIEWDKDFCIFQWSNEAEKIFGLSKNDVLGKRIDRLNLVFEDDLPRVESTMERLTGGKEIKVISQNRNYTKNRDVIECIWYNSVLLDENGKMSSVMSLVENVTLLKRYQKELISSNEKYEELLANARSIIVKQDTTGRFTYFNEFGLQFFGYEEEELIGKMAVETIVPHYESTGRDLNEMIEKINNDPDNFSININENIKKNGERVWVEWHNKALYDNNNNRTGYIAIGIDITLRKKAEEKLKDSEHKLWSVLNATQETIYMFDADGIILMSNSTGLKRIKKTADQLIGHHFSEFIPPNVARLRQLKFDEVKRTGKQLKFEDERDGRIYAHNFFPVFKDDQLTSIVTYSRDITIRKKAEANLKESEDRFRTIAESLPVLISITAVSNMSFLFVNESAEKSLGYKKNSLFGKNLSDLFYNVEDLTELGRVLKEKGKIFNKEIRVKKADGTPFWIITSIRKISYMNVPAYLTAATDITETKKYQEELLRLNRTLNAQSRSSQAMMHSRNEINYLNEVCKIITRDCGHELVWIGYAQNDERKSVKIMAFHGFDNGYINQMDLTWDNDEHGNGPTGQAIKTGKPALCRNMAEDPSFIPWREAALERGYASSLVLPLNIDGRAFGAISIYSKLTDAFSESEIALLSDLTDDLAYGISFIRLTESERAAARAVSENEVKLKELVATKDKFFNIVAHDLKNPFTSLLGSSELLYENINNMTTDNVRKLALILNDSAKGGYAILQNLLDWSRSQTGLIKFNPEKINLKNIVEENLDNFQLQVMKKEINLKSDINGDIFVWADKNMINTVLRNLLSNAVKYTFKNGTILVKAVPGPEETTLSVKDTGIGMSVEKVKTLFRIDNSLSLPGTEKEQGTGLGLKLCKEFTERMGGGIWVESEPGKGSEFKFTIPALKYYDTTL